MAGQWFHIRPASCVTLPRSSAFPRSGPMRRTVAEDGVAADTALLREEPACRVRDLRRSGTRAPPAADPGSAGRRRGRRSRCLRTSARRCPVRRMAGTMTGPWFQRSCAIRSGAVPRGKPSRRRARRSPLRWPRRWHWMQCFCAKSTLPTFAVARLVEVVQEVEKGQQVARARRSRNDGRVSRDLLHLARP